MTVAEAIEVVTQRRNYLIKRVEAKQSVGWEFQWDARERDALSVLIDAGARFESLRDNAINFVDSVADDMAVTRAEVEALRTSLAETIAGRDSAAREWSQAEAALAAQTERAGKLEAALTNVRLAAARGRSFGHQATPQAPERMAERKDEALDVVLRICSGVGVSGSCLRDIPPPATEPECSSCGESHADGVMCPPYEVRRGTGPWSRKVKPEE